VDSVPLDRPTIRLQANSVYICTFGHAVEHGPCKAQVASDGGDVHDASRADGDAGVPEERVRELAEVEARLQVGSHDAGVVLRRALHRRLDHRLRRVVHLSSPSMHAGHHYSGDPQSDDVSPLATHEDIELASEGVPDRAHELLPVGAHGDVADGDGDLQALLGPPAAALLQLRRVAGARVHARAEPCQLLHDGVPDPLAPAGDQRRRPGEAPPLTAAGCRRHLLSLSLR